MTEDRDIEVTHEVSSFVFELRRLADALESGQVYTVNIDGEDVTIPKEAEFSVAHEREDGVVELEFQITWTVSDPDDNDEDAETDADDSMETESA